MASKVIKDNFFVIDSENLSDAKTHLYGYCYSSDALVEQGNLHNQSNFVPSSLGAYVYVQKIGDDIKIYQDFSGAYGLYFFQDAGENYWAFSNSFQYLVDHLKHKHHLSLNRDYANYLLTEYFSSEIYGQTLINEISVLDRSVTVNISVQAKSFEFAHTDYEENSVDINSEEGINILDEWHERYASLIRTINKLNGVTKIDLSGGFDSRMVFMLVVTSGIDLNNVWVNVLTDKLHTHAEDFEIASEIAKHYGFQINDTHGFSEKGNGFPKKDVLDFSFYLKLYCHKEIMFKFLRYDTRLYHLIGAGGEGVRNYHVKKPSVHLQQKYDYVERYSENIKNDMKASLQKVYGASFRQIQKIYKIDDDESEEIPNYLFRYMGNANHFGKANIECFRANDVRFMPLVDPSLYKLRLYDKNCGDSNLLMAVMFTRYCPDLLSFRIEGGRKIDDKTLKYAQEICKKFPYQKKERHIAAAKKYEANCNGDKNESQPHTPTTAQEMKEYLRECFKSRKMRKIFATEFDEEIYRDVEQDIETRQYFPLRHAYSVMAVCKAISDVDASNDFFESAHDSVKYADSCTNNAENERLHNELQSISSERDRLQHDLDCVHRSVSFRIGRKITWPLRKIRSFMR